MAYVDEVFKSMCRDIINNGIDTKGEEVRPIWPDTGEKAYTIKKFGVCNRYDLRKEFPILTLRRTPYKTATDEILWIYQKKSNNIHNLNSHIWDQWADENGSIGKAYGYQIGQTYAHHKERYKNALKLFMDEDIRNQYPSFNISRPDDNEVPVDIYYNSNVNIYMDQMDSVIWDLRHNPYSRRIITNTYNFKHLKDMALYPCAYSMTFNVTKDKESDKLVLNGLLNQRSNDVLSANAFNVCEYAILLCMVAQCCDMIPGELVHMIADCHIYDRHIPIIEELISRESYPAPTVKLNPDVKNFYDFRIEDVIVENYQYGEQVKFPVAV